MSEPCRFPHKIKHPSEAAAWRHKDELKREFGEDMVTQWLRPYQCGDHWHLGRDWKRFNKTVRNALRVGSATSRKQTRVRKRK